jgi:hypothetical protein
VAREATDLLARARAALYGADSLKTFTAERKRLADAAKQDGDAAAAGAIGKLAKPPVSAWAVNRLWRDARKDFAALLAAGDKLRSGDFAAGKEQRDVLARLRTRAATILADDGHNPSVAVLGRITTTLQALSATGGFDPDPPGQLGADRDPPGFEVLTGKPVTVHTKPLAGERAAKPKVDDITSKREQRLHEAAVDRAKRTADRLRHAATAQAQVVDELRAKLRDAEADLKEANNKANAAEKDLARTTREGER